MPRSLRAGSLETWVNESQVSSPVDEILTLTEVVTQMSHADNPTGNQGATREINHGEAGCAKTETSRYIYKFDCSVVSNGARARIISAGD
jgi:hypothetical protein